MGKDKRFKVWHCENGEECGGHKDGEHGRGRIVDTYSAEYAAEEASEELTGVFGNIDVKYVVADGMRVHVVDPDGIETTWTIEAKVRFNASAADWRPWTATIQWLTEPLRSAAIGARLFADMRKVIVLDGVTWITNGHVLLRAGATAPDDFARLSATSEPVIREALQCNVPLTEQSRGPIRERDKAMVTLSNGATADAQYIDLVEGVFSGVRWFASKHLTDGAMDLEPDPAFVAVSRGEVVAVVWPMARSKVQASAPPEKG